MIQVGVIRPEVSSGGFLASEMANSIAAAFLYTGHVGVNLFLA
jgi:hypothetical protein